LTFSPENLKDQIPYYLTSALAQKELVENLEAIMGGARSGYYLSASQDAYAHERLQGDGWRGLPLFSFTSGEKQDVRGILLSNTCDVSPENDRTLPPQLVFAPIVRLSAIEARFVARGISPAQVDGKVAAIKQQIATSVFYLPAGGPLEEDYVALLDDVHSVPVSAHENDNKEKLFTLSMAGFYLFVFKLSVHFCRLQENVDRSPAM